MKKLLPIILGGALLLGSGLSAPTAYAATATAATIPEGVTVRPNDVTDATAVWNLEKNLFEISFKAPTTGYYYDKDYNTVVVELTTIDKIEVSAQIGWDSGTVIKTIDAPTPGETYSFEYDGAERGKSYTFQVQTYAFGTYGWGATVYGAFAGALPGKVGNVKVETTKGQLPVTVSFTAPKYYKDRDIELKSLTKVRLFSEEYDWASYKNIVTEYAVFEPAEPGKEYSVTITEGLKEGSQSWYVEAWNEDGASDRTDVSFYLGEDIPGSVGNINLVEQEDGTVLVTWDAPATGYKGGYFDPATLEYKIAVYVGDVYVGEELASGLTDTRYVYTPSVDEPTLIKFGITASNATGSGSELTSGQILIGPALSLPFIDTFDTPTSYSVTADHIWGNSTNSGERYPVTWRYDTYAYVSDEQVKPLGGEGGLAYIIFYSNSPAADYHLSSSKIDLGEAKALDFGFSYYQGSQTSTVLSASISFDGGDFNEVYKVDFEKPSGEKGWVNVAKNIRVPAGAKTAVIRFTSTKTGANDNTQATVIDQVSLKEGIPAKTVYPASATDFTAAYDKSAKAINLSFKAPLNSHATLGEVNDEPLEYITRIDLFRAIGYGTDYTVLNSFANPAPGQTLTFADTDLAVGGDYYYKVIVYVDEYCDYGQFLDQPVTVGQIPVDVNDLVITSNLGKAPVTLSFTAPAKDIKGEDLEEIKQINISRYNDTSLAWDELTPITADITPGARLTYTDQDVTSGKTYQYKVIVVGTAGSTYGTIASVFVALDEPLAPAQVVATANADGTVTITWEAPTAGINDGCVDTENLTYNILRGNGYSDYDATPIKENVKGTSFTDDPKFAEENAVKYFVKANNHGLYSAGGISNVVLSGPAPTLPFEENFDVSLGGGITSAQHTTWTTETSETSGSWSFAELAYIITEGQVQPVDGGVGLAYVYYGIYSSSHREDYLVSGNINIENAQDPRISFYVYGQPGYDSTLDLEISTDGGEFASVKKFDYKTDFAAAGWQKNIVDLDVPASAKQLRVRFHAHKGDYSCSVAIDNIRVYDEAESVASIGTSDITVGAANGTITVAGAADNDAVAVFDLAGATVANGCGNCTLPVAPGLYIVKVGAAPAVKVIVK